MTRGKVREKLLERELEKLAGANWQVKRAPEHCVYTH